MKKVAIIGAGPAGIMASIKLKELTKGKLEVILIEKTSRIGKKF